MDNYEQQIKELKLALEIACKDLRCRLCIECFCNGLIECDDGNECCLTREIQPSHYLEKAKEIKYDR